MRLGYCAGCGQRIPHIFEVHPCVCCRRVLCWECVLCRACEWEVAALLWALVWVLVYYGGL